MDRLSLSKESLARTEPTALFLSCIKKLTKTCRVISLIAQFKASTLWIAKKPEHTASNCSMAVNITINFSTRNYLNSSIKTTFSKIVNFLMSATLRRRNYLTRATHPNSKSLGTRIISNFQPKNISFLHSKAIFNLQIKTFPKRKANPTFRVASK